MFGLFLSFFLSRRVGDVEMPYTNEVDDIKRPHINIMDFHRRARLYIASSLLHANQSATLLLSAHFFSNAIK